MTVELGSTSLGSNSTSNSGRMPALSQEPPLFNMELEDSSVICKVISEIDDPNDSSVMIMSADGLGLVATGDKTSQVSVFFAKKTFNRFVFNASDQVKFRFALKDVIESLIFLQDNPKDDEPSSTKVSLKVTYRKKGDPLKWDLSNNLNYSIDCDIREFSLPPVHTLISFTPYEDVADIVFHSSALYKCLSSLDLTSPFVTLKLGLEDKPIVWEAGCVEFELRTADEPAIIKRAMNCPSFMLSTFTYRTQLLKPAFNALRSSTSMLLRCGSSGLLIMEHFHDSQSVEYYIPCEAKES